jgi:hypothetical protein
MKHTKGYLCFLLLSGFSITVLQAQEAISTAGGIATGSGASSVSYSVGQIFFNTYSGSNGTIAQGVQQPYEISVVTAIENAEGIKLECKIYPNPTRSQIKLVVKSIDFNNLTFQLYDLNGICIQDKNIDSVETEILMGSLRTSTYILIVLKGNMEIKTFKIIKN